MNTMQFTLITKEGATPLTVSYDQLFAIGYAGRNVEKTQEHIEELAQLGVPAPKRIPTIFQCSNLLLTQEEGFHVVGERTCGEVEYVLVRYQGKTYVGVGSDHTDRELESQSVPKSKQVCPKPIGRELWDYEELKDHWDSIRLLSYQMVDGEEILYQEGTLADILPVERILAELDERVGEIGNAVIFSGTVPALGGFRFGTAFRGEMIDDTLNRKQVCAYQVWAVSEEER